MHADCISGTGRTTGITEDTEHWFNRIHNFMNLGVQNCTFLTLFLLGNIASPNHKKIRNQLANSILRILNATETQLRLVGHLRKMDLDHNVLSDGFDSPAQFLQIEIRTAG